MSRKPISFLFKNESLEAYEGERLTTALWKNGIRELNRSFKQNQPRGMYCGTGLCQSCYVLYQGKKARACHLSVSEGMQIEEVSHE